MYYSATKHSIFFLILVIFLGCLNSYNFFNTFQETTINLLCLFLIMTIGISHGSLDNLKGEKLLKIYKIKNQSIFYFSYIFICLVVILIWLLLPSLMLCIFLLVASYHFGKEDSIIFHSQEFTHGFKRFYKPIYLPLLSLVTCLIFFTSKEDVKFTFYKYTIFLTGIMAIVISEITVKYVSNISGLYLFILFPLFSIFSLYIFTYIKSNLKFKLLWVSSASLALYLVVVQKEKLLLSLHLQKIAF